MVDCWCWSQAVVNANTSDIAKNKIASSLFSHMFEPKIYLDVCFMTCFHKSFWHKHFLWLQAADAMARYSGFRIPNMLGHFFIMSQDIKHVNNTVWSIQNKDFNAFHHRLNNLNEQTKQIQQQIQAFLKESNHALIKQFGCWVNQLLPCSLFSVNTVAMVTGHVILKNNHPP